MHMPLIVVDNYSMRVPEQFALTAWADPLVERLGYRLDSRYFLKWHAHILGPTATLLAFNLGQLVLAMPDDAIASVDAAQLGRTVGLGAGVEHMSRHNPFARSMRRLVKYGVARVAPDGDVLELRRSVPMLNARQLSYLSETMLAAHHAETLADGHRAA